MPGIAARFVDCHVFRRRADGGAQWLVLRRAPDILLGGTWQMVSGHIENGETAYQAAFREMREETGIQPLHFFQASYVNRFYLAQTDEIVLSPVFAAQAPRDAQVQLSPEHTAFAWVPRDEALRRYPWPGQRQSLQVLHEQFVAAAPRPESILDGLLGLRGPANDDA